VQAAGGRSITPAEAHLKILIAEDDLILRTLLEELLGRWNHEVIACEDGVQALEQLDAGTSFDVAILDWMMPGAAGVEVCARIRQVCSERRPYVIMLTAKSQVEDLVSGLDAGADDYLTKPYRTPELSARLRAAERLMRMQDDLIAAKRHVVYQAEHDPHTDTLNRATFLGRLHRLLGEREHAGRPLSIVRADLAGFRAINEEHGIEAGDEILRLAAQRIKSVAGRDTLVARTGGDEFSLLLAEATDDDAERMCAAIHAVVRQQPFDTTAGPVEARVDVCHVTASAPGELDMGWLLCALDAIAESTPSRVLRHEDRVAP
jgi:two-component system, cell cycle response regulator